MPFLQVLIKGFIGGIKSLPEVLKNLLRLPLALWLFIKAIFHHKWKHHRRCPCENEVQLPHDVYKRADPLIYDQYYLMKMGLSVTWDNPDIQLYKGGVPVSSSDLKQNEDYDVEVRVWNGSYDAPALGLPVFLSYLSFGAGTTSTFIGKKLIDLGAKGTSMCPAFAKFKWTTPPAAGHYCLQAVLSWPDDANPDNNLGQENVEVGQLHSPAQFVFKARNNRREARRFIYQTDDYTIPPLKECDDQDDTGNIQGRGDRKLTRLEESKMRWAWALSEQGYGKFAKLDDWIIIIQPDKDALMPLEEINVKVSIEPKSIAFTGSKAFNIHVFSLTANNEKFFEGGVTLTVEK